MPVKNKSVLSKTFSVLVATTIAAGTMLPAGQAAAHDRHNPHAHNIAPHKWSRKFHRKFHNHYGPGHHGVVTYQSARHAKKRKKRRDNGDLIAAGIIGLAVGAIIASAANENSRKHRHSNHVPAYTPPPPPQVIYPESGYGYQDPGYGGGQVNRIPLDQYGQPLGGQTGYTEPSVSGPNVITYQDTVSLEPWTPGWYDYCRNRYRSFNPKTGTFFGYDGHHHFCVPK